MIQSIFHHIWFLGDVLGLLALAHGRSFFLQAILFLDRGFGAVLVEELEDGGGGVAVEGVRELREGGGHFEAHVEDFALALQAHVLRPFDHTADVALGLDVLADAEVAGAAFDEGVLGGVSGGRFWGLKEGVGWRGIILAVVVQVVIKGHGQVIVKIKIGRQENHTFCTFLEPDLPDARGAGAVLLPDFGGYRSWRKEPVSKCLDQGCDVSRECHEGRLS